ncbi:unnamed protein product, partial [Symbiodinium sp. KB8]
MSPSLASPWFAGDDIDEMGLGSFQRLCRTDDDDDDDDDEEEEEEEEEEEQDENVNSGEEYTEQE